MQMWLSEIAEIVCGKQIGNDVAIASVSIDTRTLSPGQLYIAIKGHNFDGNDFVGLAEQTGAIAAIVHEDAAVSIPHVIVEDTRLALAQLAKAWRQKAAIPVVGITGSNGKTTVKEMVAAILSVAGKVLYTQGNLNNDIGVPLTLLRLNDADQFAVIEMGANHPGEIAYTSACAQADVVILNNAGAAHIEGFGSLDGVAKAKGEIIETLKEDGIAIINRDDRYFDYWQQLAGNRRVLSFGLDENANVTAQAIKTELRDNVFVTVFQLVASGYETVEVELKLAGTHNVLNALAAAAAGLALGLDLTQIAQGLAKVKPVTGRLQPLLGRLGNIVIDDTYNANSASLKVGLDVLINCPGEPWLVLGAFGELGPESQNMHREIGELIKASGVTRLLATGADTRYAVEAFGPGAIYFDTQEALIASLRQELTGNETILVKGSRMQRMENVVATLVDNFRN